MLRIAVRSVMYGVLALSCSTVQAEPIGKWFSGWAQGISEYGIKNDSAGSDDFYIACNDAGGATVMFIVSGHDPVPGSDVFVTVGDDNYELPVSEDKLIHTDNHSASANFGALWDDIRKSSGSMHVRLSTGEATVFTLKGAAKALPKDHCTTAYEK